MVGEDDFTKGLLDDDAFDPEKLFDDKQYSTLIIKRDGFNKKQNNVADLIEALLDQRLKRSDAEEIFTQLKEAKAQQMLVNAIEEAEHTDDKQILVAACWECGLDFSDHLLFFTRLACSADFAVAMEALTVVENMEEVISTETLTAALNLIASSHSPNTELVRDLTENIKTRIA